MNHKVKLTIHRSNPTNKRYQTDSRQKKKTHRIHRLGHPSAATSAPSSSGATGRRPPSWLPLAATSHLRFFFACTRYSPSISINISQKGNVSRSTEGDIPINMEGDISDWGSAINEIGLINVGSSVEGQVTS